MRAEHELAPRDDEGRADHAPARRGVAFLRRSGRSLLVEQVEIELLRLEREEVASACADGARLALAMRAQDPTAGATATGAPSISGRGDEASSRRGLDASMLTRLDASFPTRLDAWRERVRGLLAALQLEGLAVPSVLAQAFGGAIAAWPSAASLAQAACVWSPSDEHRVLCARALCEEGSADEAREWLRSVPPEGRPRDLARDLGLDSAVEANPRGAHGAGPQPLEGGLS